MKKIAIANPEGVVTAKSGEEILASDNSIWLKIADTGNVNWVMVFDQNQMVPNALPLNISTTSPYTFLIESNNSIKGYDLVTIPNNWRNAQIIKGVALGNRVTNIGQYAFANNQIFTVFIPNSVTTIGGYAFAHNQLNRIIIPDSVTSIGNYAFAFNSITKVTIPNSVTLIDNGAFSSNDLISINIPNSISEITNYTFANNQLTSITIPNSVTTIGNGAFSNNQLISVVIPNSVTTIGDYAFYNNQLTSVTIPNSVTTIGSNAFYNNQLTSVTIPNSVTTIGNDAFRNNDNLATVNCYIVKSIIDAATNIFLNTSSSLVIHARASDNTWTAGSGQNIGGNPSVTVVKDL
jgi:hypothetical protein